MGRNGVSPKVKLSNEHWHAIEEDEILKKLHTSRQGLNDDEARRNLSVFGQNTLPGKKIPGIFEVILHQLVNPLIFILIIAAIASAIVGEYIDAFFILFVITLNTALGAYKMIKAKVAIQS
jgi:magnesium-transporting ATPase (P-type)